SATIAADENFVSFFDVNVIAGDAKNGLTEPNSIMLSEEVAEKYFGNENPVNKMVSLDGRHSMRVTGVFKGMPVNSHLHPRLLVSFSTLKNPDVYGDEALRTNWGNNAFMTYVRLPVNYPPGNIEKQFPAFLDKHMANEYGGARPSALTTIHLEKLTDIHLRSHRDDEMETPGDIRRVYIFAAIALFILLIACINYMNLATARSVLRAKEIGIRKVSGATRTELMSQFLTESVLITLIALIISLVLTWITLPLMSKLAGVPLESRILLNPAVIASILLIPILVGLVAGVYPAVFMSSFQPVKTLKGFLKIGTGSATFRQGLVVLQFSISIILIISTAIVFQQLNYMKNTDLGYDRSQVITMDYQGKLNESWESFRQRLLQNPKIAEVGRSSRIPTGRLLDSQGAGTIEGDSVTQSPADLKYLAADEKFIPTYKIKLIAGRNFSKEFGMDSSSFILNEAGVKAMGWNKPSEVIGKAMSYGGVRGRVIGVTKDYHFESMHQSIVPLIMLTGTETNNNYRRISVRITGDDVQSTVTHIGKTFSSFVPEQPFQYNFLDERYQRLYESEQKQGNIFGTFSGIAIFIACLGLFGLSAFAITQRMKEIGVRKVLGASVSSIVRLLSKDFLKLVAIAALIAFPVAWFVMHNWLQDFAYRVTIGWWIFIAAGFIAAIIAVATISIQAVKAALSNPVKSLKSE
ncbi:MAG: ABC transporter permease, partial [Chitinophagaceae bacterium]